MTQMNQMNSFVFKIKKDFFFQYTKKQLFKNKSGAWKLSLKTSDLQIKSGFVAIAGESGTGKSTLISILGGFERLSKEQAQKIVYFHKDQPVTCLDKSFSRIKKNDFGFIFQRCYESKSLNAIDNIAMPLINQNYSEKTARQYCSRLLETVGLNDLKSSSANELSGGQLTRVGILRGIAQSPKVLFADEPANNLDEENAKQVLEILKQWQKKTGGTVIMVTHHLNQAFQYADQIIILQSIDSHAGNIVYYHARNASNWSDNEKNKIRKLLSIHGNKVDSFPDPPVNEKKFPANRIGFLLKIAWKNIVSKADSSRTISFITLFAFTLLFFTVFSGQVLINWFYHMDQIKNNDAFLRKFEIEVSTEKGLSKEIQKQINSIKIKDIQDWLLERMQDKTRQLNIQCDKINIDCPVKRSMLQMELLVSKHLLKIKNMLKQFSFQVLQYQSIESIDRKALKQIEHQSQSMIHLLELFYDIASMNPDDKACQVFPRWSAGPEFVKKNGQRNNLTTTIRWLDYQDPFFHNPRLKYLVNPNFRFKSNDDEGIILDIETLVDDLGYALHDREVKLIYKTNEITCVPVRAVVEKMPKNDMFHVVTTLGFGEKIRSCSHHCDENIRYYQCRIHLDQCHENEKLLRAFEQDENYDQGSRIYQYEMINNTTFEIYANYEYSLTRVGWEKWVSKNLPFSSDQFQLMIDPEWEVPGLPLKDPPYDRGIVKTDSARVVSALGEFLSTGFNPSHKTCKINVLEYKEKIQFSRQTQALIHCLQWTGMVLSGFLFLLFLCTNMMITIRQKASEIAIFRAMGGTLASLLLIYNFQVLLILSIAAALALLLVVLIMSPLRSLFIHLVIQSLWKTIGEQSEPIAAITTENIFQVWWFVLNINQWTCLCCLTVMIITVSLMILYVKYSKNYGVSKILKER
jgi:ABC-type lipoprotein export system ATPase subunit